MSEHDEERVACEAAFPHLSHDTALDEGLAAYRDTKMQGVWEGWQARATAPKATVKGQLMGSNEFFKQIKEYVEVLGGSCDIDSGRDGVCMRVYAPPQKSAVSKTNNPPLSLVQLEKSLNETLKRLQETLNDV